MANAFVIHQNLFNEFHSAIDVIVVDEATLVAKPQHFLGPFLATLEDNSIGLAPIYGAKCKLITLAMATLSQVLIIRLTSTSKAGKKKSKGKNGPAFSRGRSLLEANVLCRPEVEKFAFRMDRLALSLFLDYGMSITDAVDLLSSPSKAARQSFQSLMNAMGGETTLQKDNVKKVFRDEEGVNTDMQDLALQAWSACRSATLISVAKLLAKAPRIDTESMAKNHVQVLAKINRDANRLDALKPTKVKNDISKDYSVKEGAVNLNLTRFKTRIMTSSSQTIHIVTSDKGGKQGFSTGKATKVEGRSAKVTLQGQMQGDKIRAVYTLGKEDLTSAEAQRADIVLKTLQKSTEVLDQDFIKRIWLPSNSHTNSSANPASQSLSYQLTSTPLTPVHFSYRPLNASQKQAVQSILSDRAEDRITVIHGPPGTGKTTVIAAAVTSLVASPKNTVWLIAQSNVAVKNIAEKLADVGFLDFKLLVSKDFHFDWHEHLYQQIERNLIRSDTFPEDAVSAERLLLGSRVILCTLSTITNYRLANITRLVPVQRVVVDEASQIEVGDYLPLLYRFQNTLKKMAFIGDDKQLAPYGQDDLGDLSSIFEMPHLRDRAVFLDTQYRMPVPIGIFISQNVYGRQLKTCHEITTLLSCKFVDVRLGKEVKMGNSWVNQQEVRASITLARQYYQRGKAYRIITPYDSQRNVLEKELKAAKLPWEDKVFNVDSFQGNEADHIIISLVRSDKIGFLTNMRRTNVMLTRCKKSMVICTSRKFVTGIAGDSLMGKLAAVLGDQAWLACP